MVPFSFAGQSFVAGAEGALYWPARQALLVADLHLEKASWFARSDSSSPIRFACELTARRGGGRNGAKRIYCLGDSFTTAPVATGAAARDLEQMTAELDWVWIVGNHDPGFADHCGGRLTDELEIVGIVLRHEAVRSDPRPEMSGHFHPKLRMHLKGRQVSRRCFVISKTKLILPAFGSLTGGLDATHPEILGNVGDGAMHGTV